MRPRSIAPSRTSLRWPDISWTPSSPARNPGPGHLLPSDTPETSVAEDQVHRGGPLTLRRLQFVNAHQESAVSAHGHDPAIRIGELRRDSPREGDAHRRQAVRDDDRVRLHRPEEPAEPEFVSSHVRDHQIVGPEDAAEPPQAPPRLDPYLRTFPQP